MQFNVWLQCLSAVLLAVAFCYHPAAAQMSAPSQPEWVYQAVPSDDNDFSEPVVVGENAIAAGTAGAITAINIETGRVSWIHMTDGAARVPVVPAGDVIIAASDTVIEALDSTSGKPVWSFGKRATQQVWATPVVVDDLVVFGTTASPQIHALDLETGGEIWRLPVEGAAIGEFAFADGVVAYPDRSGFVYGVSVADGTPLWTVAAGSTEAGSNSAKITAINGQFYVLTNQGTVQVIDPQSGGLISEAWVGEGNSPADIMHIDDNSLVVLVRTWMQGGSFGTLARVDASTLQVSWSVRIDELPTTNLMADADHLYLGTIEGTINALSLDDSLQQWAYNIPSPLAGLASDGEAGLLVSTSDAELYRLKGSGEQALCPGVGIPSTGASVGTTPNVIVAAESADILGAPSNVGVVLETVSQCTVLEVGTQRATDGDTNFIQVTGPTTGRVGWIDITAVRPVVLDGD